MTHVTCRLSAKNRDQLRNPRLGNRVSTTFTSFYVACVVTHTTACMLGLQSVSVSSQSSLTSRALNRTHRTTQQSVHYRFSAFHRTAKRNTRSHFGRVQARRKRLQTNAPTYPESLGPRTRWISLECSPDLPAGFTGTRREDGKGKGRKKGTRYRPEGGETT